MKFIQDIEIIVIGNIVVITQNKMKKGKTFYHSRENKNKKLIQGECIRFSCIGSVQIMA